MRIIIFLLFFACISANKLLSQMHVPKCSCYEGKHFAFDDNRLERDILFMPGGPGYVSKRVIDPATHKIIAELITANDSAFYSYQFDSLCHIKAAGLILSMYIGLEKREIPDWQQDPDGSRGLMKDTMLSAHQWVKDGLWREKDSLGFTWIGNYKRGCKDGYWSRGKYSHRSHTPELWFIISTSIRYDDGLADPISFSDYSDYLWPTLKGKWYLHKAKGDTMVLSRRPDLTQFEFNFISQTECQFRIPSKIKDDKIVRSCGWGSRLIGFPGISIYYEDKYYRYQVLEVNKNHLILRIVQNRSGAYYYYPYYFLD